MQMAKKSTPYILIAPAFLFLILIIVFPFIFTIRNSFMNWNLQTSVAPAGFVGGANYRLVFEDPTFLAAIVNTLKLSFAGTIIEFALGLVVALLLYEGLKGTKKIRALLIMPVTVAPMIAGLIFRYLYDADGLIPFLLHWVGIGTPKQGILGNEHTVLWGVLLTDLWQWTPFFAIILLAGLQSISDEMIEAATVDGASYLKRLWHILLPNLNFVAVMIFLIRFMQLFNLFDIIFAETRGGPGVASRTLSYNLYYAGLIEFNIGYSSAVAVIMILISMVIINVFIFVTFRGKEL